uniref:Triadin n=1 Tax=Gouania willdenowi TaxID=441366 RepID=A0A8C5HVU1_GOUWI
MSSPSSVGEGVAPSRPSHKSFLDELVETFTSPMAWLLIVALVITWSAVAIVLFDLLDYKTLAGLPPPPAIAKRVSHICFHSLVKNESTDWLEMIWSFAASLFAPDDEEEEGIHQNKGFGLV